MRRIFIAINLPELVRREIIDWQNKLKKFNWPVRWPSPENIHLTLRFLGSTTEREIVAIRKIVGESTKLAGSFILTIKQFLILPDFESPRIFALKIENNQKLFDLQKSITGTVAEQGIGELERHPFTGHITIGRMNSARIDLSALDQLDFRMEFVVKSVEVMESVLKPAGPVYSIIQSFNLKKL